MYRADQICNVIDFLEDNIFVKFGGGWILSRYCSPYWNKLCSIAC